MSLSFFSKTLVRPLQPLFNIQTAGFSKYISKSRTKRLPLTTKRVAKGYNKGNGARKEGVLDSKGKFMT
jgi:large subunit ribosomal protein L41